MKGLKSKLIIAGIGLASLFSIKSHAQLNGNIEYIKSEKSSNSYVRLNSFYGSSDKIKGFTFLELYGDKKGYYGKTTLTKKLNKNISVKTQIKHVNEPYTSQGLGVGTNFSTKNKKLNFNLSYYPFWMSKKMKTLNNNSMLSYFASLKLPKNFNISSFGEVNLANEDGPTWTYGEISIDKKIKKWTFGYNPALKRKSSGNPIPKIENRIFIKKTF